AIVRAARAVTHQPTRPAPSPITKSQSIAVACASMDWKSRREHWERTGRDWAGLSDVRASLSASKGQPQPCDNPPKLGGCGYWGLIERWQLHSYNSLQAARPPSTSTVGSAAMTVTIDGVEPNIFPAVDDLDASDAGRHVEVYLDVSVDGKPITVTIKLSYEQASDLATLL